MKRSLSALVVLGLLAGCGSSDSHPPWNTTVFPDGGGHGGAGGTAHDAAVDAYDDGPDTGLDEGGIDAADDTNDSSADADIACVQDPIPTQGQNYCVTIDGDGYQCDPITAVPCNVGAGEVCDFDGQRFVCMPEDAALVAPCGSCGGDYPSTCIAGFTCLGLGSKCTRYCCDSLQCALGQVCVMQPPTSLGICQATSDQVLAGFVGAPPPDGGSDASLPAFAPECNPPAAPGQGTCVDTTSPEFPCNPVTNAGCDPAASEVCDNIGAGFQCIAGKHEGGICDPCTSLNCKAGSTCIPDLGCVKYCCGDTECAPGYCLRYPGLGGLGVCSAPEPDGGS